VDGVLVETSTRTWRQLDVLPGQTVSFWVTDDANELPPIGLPSTAWITWDESESDESVRYEVDQWIEGQWVARGIVMDLGEPWFRWQSGVLPDGVETRFRVRAVDGNGIEGLPIEIGILMVRVPDRLNVAATWNAEAATASVAW
jgi:hypothetical protein